MPSSSFASLFGGIGRALSARDYRVYWYSHVFSANGVWMHRMAVGVLIFHLTGSPAWLGLIGFLYAVPQMVLGPIAGAIADRAGIRRTAIAAAVVTVVLSAVMGGLTFAQSMTPMLLAALVVALGCAQAFDFPVRQVLIQLLVGPERMSAAIALNSTTFYTASFTGPMLCAAILSVGERYVGATAPGLVFLLYGATMIGLLVAIARTRMRDRPPQRGESSRFVGDVMEGLRYTLGNRQMRGVIVLWCGVSLLARPYVDLLPGYAVAVFDRGTDGVGTLIAASGLGALFLSAIMALRGRLNGVTRMLVIAAAGASAALAAFSAAADFWLSAAFMTLVGGGLVVCGIASQSLIQHITDNALRARVISVYFALVIGAQSIGVLAVGWVAEHYGFRIAFGAGAALSLALVAAVGPGLWRRAPALEAPRSR